MSPQRRYKDTPRFVIAWKTAVMSAPSFHYENDPREAARFAETCAYEGSLVYFKPVKEK